MGSGILKLLMRHYWQNKTGEKCRHQNFSGRVMPITNQCSAALKGSCKVLIGPSWMYWLVLYLNAKPSPVQIN